MCEWTDPSGVFMSDLGELSAATGLVWAVAFGFRFLVDFLLKR